MRKPEELLLGTPLQKGAPRALGVVGWTPIGPKTNFAEKLVAGRLPSEKLAATHAAQEEEMADREIGASDVIDTYGAYTVDIIVLQHQHSVVDLHHQYLLCDTFWTFN